MAFHCNPKPIPQDPSRQDPGRQDPSRQDPSPQYQEKGIHTERVFLREAIHRRRGVRLLKLLHLTLAPLIIIGMLVEQSYGLAAQSWWRGERNLAGQRIYQPAAPGDSRYLASIDWREVVGRKLPQWVVQVNRAPGGVKEAKAFEALIEAVQNDRNIVSLYHELRALVSGKPQVHQNRIEYLSWAISNYLDQQGIPWRLEFGINASRKRSTLFLKSYRILADFSVGVGQRPVRTRILTRADHLNVQDEEMGRSSKEGEGAFIILERVREHAVNHVWPMLNELSAHGTSTDSRFSQAMQTEVGKALSQAHYRTLSNTAPSRRSLLIMEEAINERALSCKQEDDFPAPGILGYGDRFLDTIETTARETEDSPCTPITESEAETIVAETHALREAPGLEEALAALIAHLMNGVIAHEARHVADNLSTGGRQPGRYCLDCPEYLSLTTQAEVSAYLSSFAQEGTGYSSLHQACRVAQNPGSHVRALGYVLPQLMAQGCADGPPASLPERARQLEVQLFANSDVVRIPDQWVTEPLPLK